MNAPSVVRAVPDDSRETLRRALQAMAMQAREIVRLRAELADAQAQNAEFRDLIQRLT